MKPKRNKLVIWVLLGIAGLLGIAAIVTAVIYSQIDDVNPNRVDADATNPECMPISILVENELGDWEPYPEDQDLSLSQEILVQGEFIGTSQGDGYVYDGFEMVVGDFRKQILLSDPGEDLYDGLIDISQNSDESSFTFSPQFIYAEGAGDFGDSDTVSFTIIPLTEGLDGEMEPTTNVICSPRVYNLDTTADPNQQFECIEIGEYATDVCQLQTDPSECTIEPTPCCSGLTRVDTCAEPDANNECIEENNGCYTCLENVGDGFCNSSAGENICNSPSDCLGAEDPPDDDDPPQEDPPEDDPPEDDPPEDDPPEDDPDTDPEEEDPPSTETSNFVVEATGPTCVERIAPNNEITVLITVTNNDVSYEEILQVKNKLPLGFEYQAGSSVINGVPDLDDTYTSVNSTGNTEEIIWSVTDGWSVNAGDVFTIEYKAIAGDNAITGEVQNEVIVTPLNTPQLDETLRTEMLLNVAQSCSTPETAIFGNSWMKALLGLVTIVVAYYFYNSSKGSEIASTIGSSGAIELGEDAIDSIRGLYTKATDPRKHFEEKVAKKDRRRK